MEYQNYNSPNKVGFSNHNFNLGHIEHDNTNKNYLLSSHTKINLPIIEDSDELSNKSKTYTKNNKNLQFVNKAAEIGNNKQYYMNWIDVSNVKPSVKNTQI